MSKKTSASKMSRMMRTIIILLICILGIFLIIYLYLTIRDKQYADRICTQSYKKIYSQLKLPSFGQKQAYLDNYQVCERVWDKKYSEESTARKANIATINLSIAKQLSIDGKDVLARQLAKKEVNRLEKMSDRDIHSNGLDSVKFSLEELWQE